MSATITQGFLDNKIFSIVSEVAERLGVRAFVIGGYVRDCFLGRQSKDIDIVVEGSGIELAEAVGEQVHSNVSVFRNFGTAMLRYHGIEIEFVGARKESYRRDSTLGKKVDFAGVCFVILYIRACVEKARSALSSFAFTGFEGYEMERG